MPTIEEIVQRDIWSVAEGSHNELPLIIRFREEFKDRPDVSCYPHRLIVSWKYAEGESGLPSGELSFELGQFEDYLVEALESDLVAVLSAVITNAGERQWIFYTKNLDSCQTRINALPQVGEPYPLHLTAEPDSEWEFLYDGVLAGMQ